MTIAEAIQHAANHGYRVQSLDGMELFFGANQEYSVWTRTDNHSSFMTRVEETFLDRQFWRALGEALKWYASDGQRSPQDDQPWQTQWHQFLQYLAAGKTAEDFFGQLSAPEQADASDAEVAPLP